MVSSPPSPSRLQRLLNHSGCKTNFAIAADAAIVQAEPLHQPHVELNASERHVQPERVRNGGLSASALRYPRRAQYAPLRASGERQTQRGLASHSVPTEQRHGDQHIGKGFLHNWVAEAPLNASPFEGREAAIGESARGRAERSHAFWQRQCYKSRLGKTAGENVCMTSRGLGDSVIDDPDNTLADHWVHACYRDTMHGRANDRPLGLGPGACQPSITSKSLTFEPGRELHPGLMEFADDLLRERISAAEADLLFIGGKDKTGHFSQPASPSGKTHLFQQRGLGLEDSADLACAITGGETLARRMRTANDSELLELASWIRSCCREVPKEQALRLCLQLSEVSRRLVIDAQREALRDAVHALLTTVIGRIRDAHGPDFLVEILEAMPNLSIFETTYFDTVLTALFPWVSRAPLTPQLAHRAARAIADISEGLTAIDMQGLAAGSRRTVISIKDVIQSNPAVAVDRHLSENLERLTMRDAMPSTARG